MAKSIANYGWNNMAGYVLRPEDFGYDSSRTDSDYIDNPQNAANYAAYQSYLANQQNPAVMAAAMPLGYGMAVANAVQNPWPTINTMGQGFQALGNNAVQAMQGAYQNSGIPQIMQQWQPPGAPGPTNQPQQQPQQAQSQAAVVLPSASLPSEYAGLQAEVPQMDNTPSQTGGLPWNYNGGPEDFNPNQNSQWASGGNPNILGPQAQAPDQYMPSYPGGGSYSNPAYQPTDINQPGGGYDTSLTSFAPYGQSPLSPGMDQYYTGWGVQDYGPGTYNPYDRISSVPADYGQYISGQPQQQVNEQPPPPQYVTYTGGAAMSPGAYSSGDDEEGS
jgi:hypothetical protein